MGQRRGGLVRRHHRAVELTSQTAVWYRSGKPPVLIRWVLIRDPQGSFATQALLCTDHAADPTQILECRLYCAGNWRSPSTRYEPIWVWRHNASGPPRHRPHHARPTGTLLLEHPGRPRVAETAPHTQRNRLVRQTVVDLRDAIALARRHLWLASEPFLTVGADADIQELTGRTVPPACRFPCLRRLNCVKPRLGKLVGTATANQRRPYQRRSPPTNGGRFS